VRELENVIERIAVLNRSGTVESKDLPPVIRQTASDPKLHGIPGTLQEVERQRILDALLETGGNKKQAARRLGIHRSTLYAKIRRYGLDEDEAGEARRDPRQLSEKPTLVTTG